MPKGYLTFVLGVVCATSVLMATFQFTICSLTKQDGRTMAQVSGLMAEEEQTDNKTEKLVELSEFLVPTVEAGSTEEPKLISSDGGIRSFQFLMDEVSSPPPEA